MQLTLPETTPLPSTPHVAPFDVAELVTRYGLDDGDAAEVLRLVGRARNRISCPPEPLCAQAAAARFIAAQFAVPHQEVLGAIFLNSRNYTLRSEVLFRGTVDRAAVSPAPILRTALLAGATGLILFHTHPSGDPSPSLDDVAFTKVVRDAARIFQIRLHDHLIVAHPLQPTNAASYYSMRNQCPDLLA